MGCGNGFFYRRLLPRNLRPAYVGFDINEESLHDFQKMTSDGNPAVFQANAYKVPLGDESVDVWIGFSSYDSVADLALATREINRCLRPGGVAIFFQDILPANYVGTRIEGRAQRYFQELQGALTHSGLAIKESVELSDYVIGPRLECQKKGNLFTDNKPPDAFVTDYNGRLERRTKAYIPNIPELTTSISSEEISTIGGDTVLEFHKVQVVLAQKSGSTI